jgi:hypothetical protein
MYRMGFTSHCLTYQNPDTSHVSAIISSCTAGDENSIIDMKSWKRGCHDHDEDDCDPLDLLSAMSLWLWTVVQSLVACCDMLYLSKQYDFKFTF